MTKAELEAKLEYLKACQRENFKRNQIILEINLTMRL